MCIEGHTITIAVTVMGLNSSSEIDYIVLYSENYTEIARQPATLYEDFHERVAVSDFVVPDQVIIIVFIR